MQLPIKQLVVTFLFITLSFSANCQEKKNRESNRFFFYWGWNRSSYTPSDIHFKGNSFDFKLHNVRAKDRQTPIALDPYFHPLKITIPQVNYAIGYCLDSHTSISFGVDHMKYVVVRNQITNISGNISNSIYEGSYQDQSIKLVNNFLLFEHTDGLNYVFIELNRYSKLARAKKWGSIYFSKGISVAAMYPKTNITLLGHENYDEFNLTGYGCAIKLGTRFELWKKLFFSNEIKAGYIHMPKIPISNVKGEFATQQFCFFQTNILFGYILDFKKKPQTNTQ